MTFHSALYRGHLTHARHDALTHRTFRYGVYMAAAIDLDELVQLDRELRWFSYDRRNVFAFRDRDYAASLSPTRAATAVGPASDLRADLATLLAANDLPVPHATRLVTNLRAFGYLFNPVSFFLNYDASGNIVSVVAEVNNTYGGGFRYLLRDRIAGPRTTFRHTRELFVSPFLHGRATYEFTFDAPLDGDRIAIAMHVRDDAGERVFAATFDGARAALSDRVLAAAALRYPLMTAQVIGLIHWQALKLRLSGVPYRRPGTDQRPLPRSDRVPYKHGA